VFLERQPPDNRTIHFTVDALRSLFVSAFDQYAYYASPPVQIQINGFSTAHHEISPAVLFLFCWSCQRKDQRPTPAFSDLLERTSALANVFEVRTLLSPSRIASSQALPAQRASCYPSLPRVGLNNTQHLLSAAPPPNYCPGTAGSTASFTLTAPHPLFFPYLSPVPCRSCVRTNLSPRRRGSDPYLALSVGEDKFEAHATTSMSIH